MIANGFYHSCLALSASSKVDLSEFSEFYNKYDKICKIGSWWKNELKGLCIKIDAAWRPRVK